MSVAKYNTIEKIFNIFDLIPWSELSDNIAVAFSGGVDSLALTLLLNEYLKNKNIKLTAITVDHGLRTESKTEAEVIHEQLSKLNINHHILTWSPCPKDVKTGKQKKARNARYNLINKWCVDNNINAVFFAHHNDDQIETFWLRLMKHSGLDGLACMSFLRKDNHSEISVFRPLLGFSKEELIDICTYYNQKWLEDPSNQSVSFTRNAIRQNIKDFPLDKTQTLRLINCFAIIRKNLQEHTTKIIDSCIVLHKEGYITLSTSIWSKQNQEIQKRILQNILVTISGATYPPRKENLLNAMLKMQENISFTSFGCTITHNKDTAIFCREAIAIDKQKIINGKFIWDNRFKFSCVDVPENTYITTLGKRGLSFLTKEDKKIYIDKYKKLPKYVRQSLPVFEKNDKIIAIPHIKYGENKINVEFLPKINIYGVYIEII